MNDQAGQMLSERKRHVSEWERHEIRPRKRAYE